MKKKITKVPKFKDFKTTRATSSALEKILYKQIPILDHGFIRVIDYMGTDQSIVQAARVSYGEGTKKLREDRGLIRYLLSHWHTTPFEMCEIKFHIKLPIFVARQWIRHRTANVNEYSARYSVLDKEFYIPEMDQLGSQSTTNKQGRSNTLDKKFAKQAQDLIKKNSEQLYDAYQNLLNGKLLNNDEYVEGEGLARELARTTLPLNYYTQWYWKIDLHNLMHFLRLRADSHAQYEIQIYAEKMVEILKKWVPLTFEAFEDYRSDSFQLSKEGSRLLKDKLANKKIKPSNYKLSLREIREIEKYNFVEIGNHSHSHEYLVDESPEIIKKDILRSIEIFNEKLGKNSKFFSYPFGEFSEEFKKIINAKFEGKLKPPFNHIGRGMAGMARDYYCY